MRKPRHRTSAFLRLLLGSSTVLSGEQIEFNRDIRPILSDHCFACHGFDANTRKSKLRLDTSEGAFAKRKGLAAITPGDPVTSSVWHRITSNDPDEVMPPPEAHKVLEADEIALIKQWIEEGANYQAHWAFVPPKRNFVSESKTNPIDHFIRKKLSREGLKPSPPADKATLIRRVTLDLTGLPPTPEQVAAFLEDSSPEAYENLVDHLMATRDYAERRAQDWLDLARYADTRGFADDQQREIWPYRDWVVRALHHNMPFDQFTIEQLAGDLLPDATDEQKIATAFHRNAPQAKGQTYPVEEYRLKGVTDRVNTTGKVWLGLTMECAECHDHKFDPISQEDYFSLFALFNNIEHSGSGFQQGGPTMIHRFTPNQNDPIVASEMQRLRTELAAARRNLPARTAPGIEGLVKQWNGPQVETDHPDFHLTGDLSVIANINTAQAVANIVSKYDWKGKERAFVSGRSS